MGTFNPCTVLTLAPVRFSTMGAFAYSGGPVFHAYVLRFHRTMDRITSYLLIFHYLDPPSPYHTQIHRTASFPFSLSLIPRIFDRPWYYLVARCLSLYQWLFPYLPVRYIDSQSGGTVGFGLCLLRLVTLLARVPQ